MKTKEEFTKDMQEQFSSTMLRASALLSESLATLDAKLAEAEILRPILSMAEWRVESSIEYRQTCYLTVDHLRQLRKIFGPFKIDRDSKEVYRAGDNAIQLNVIFEREPLTINPRIIQTLPETAACRIVEQTTTYKALVCSR